jgi:hypothetical protein
MKPEMTPSKESRTYSYASSVECPCTVVLLAGLRAATRVGRRLALASIKEVGAVC